MLGCAIALLANSAATVDSEVALCQTSSKTAIMTNAELAGVDRVEEFGQDSNKMEEEQ